MIKNIIDKYYQFANLDNKIKGILDFHLDTIPVQYLYYFSYASKIWRLINKYYFSFGYDYPNSTYNYYYQMKKLSICQDKLRTLLKDYYIPKTFYTGYLDFLRKAYRLVKRRIFSDLEDLIKKEVLRNILKEEVLNGRYYLYLIA